MSSFIGGPAIYPVDAVEKSKKYEDNTTLQNLIKLLKGQGVEVPSTKDLKGGSSIRSLLRGK
jgi:hypothetical protein